MTKDELISALAPDKPWQIAYAAVAVAVRDVFDQAETVEGISTHTLVERLLPDDELRGADELAARQRLYKGLQKIAPYELAPYATRGELETGPYGRAMRRWIWHGAKAGAEPVKFGSSAGTGDKRALRIERGRNLEAVAEAARNLLAHAEGKTVKQSDLSQLRAALAALEN